MNIYIIMGSPRLNGNTATLCKPFIDELKFHRANVEYIELHGKRIAPCLGCMHCQDVSGEYGCIQKDEMQRIVESILNTDVVVFATPIYTWQATPPMKAVMDRLFGLNKFYGTAPRETLNKTKAYALLSTCGYDPSYAADLLDEVFRRLCKHSDIPYAGMYAVSDGDGDNVKTLLTKDILDGVRQFTQKLLLFGA